MMEPSNLSSLSEESPEDQPQNLSAFSSIPDRPAIQTSLQKYSPLHWLGFFDQEDDVSIPGSSDVFHVYMAGSEGPVVFCLHGGGYSGLSFALSASKIKEKARVVAMDLRGHGKSSTENELDLSIETLCNDVLAVLKTMYGDSPPAIVLVGHSMGGSVAVHVAARKLLPSLAGLIVIDVVEGTAMASLIHMQKILSSRTQHFSSIEKAIEWSVKGGSLRNLESARLSVPSTLKYDDSKKCYIYRTRLEETEQYWRGWYEGLSEKFLSCPVPKLLLLAGTDRLDRSLTIGQMQGKFQMIVVRNTGHPIQEDLPDEFATLVLNFISRNRIGPRGIAQTHGGKRGGTAMDNSPTTMAPVLLRQIFTSLFVSAESILCLVEKSKLLQFFRHLLVYIFLSLLPILPSLFPSLNPSPEFYPLKPLKTVDHHSLAKAGDSSLARALSQLLSIMYELPISSRKYDVVRSLAEKVIDENLRQGFEPLRELNRTVLSAAFLRNLERLEAAVTEQERERAAKAGGVGAFDFRLIRAVRALVLKSRPGATRKEVSGCVEKLAAEMLWLAQKLVASGGAEEAVCNWGSASNLAWLAVSAEPRLQCSLVKVSAFLFNQAKEMGHNRDANGAEGKSEQQRQHKLKILMSWLPFLCWASSGIDAPVLTRSERTELEMVLEDIISTLKHEEEQEKVLALWLHHFTCSPSSDWPNLQACYERWCNASRKLLLLQ